jgi:hypothetical protein
LSIGKEIYLTGKDKCRLKWKDGKRFSCEMDHKSRLK